MPGPVWKPTSVTVRRSMTVFANAAFSGRTTVYVPAGKPLKR